MVINRSFKSTSTRSEFEFSMIEPWVSVNLVVLRFEMAELMVPYGFR